MVRCIELLCRRTSRWSSESFCLNISMNFTVERTKELFETSLGGTFFARYLSISITLDVLTARKILLVDLRSFFFRRLSRQNNVRPSVERRTRFDGTMELEAAVKKLLPFEIRFLSDDPMFPTFRSRFFFPFCLPLDYIRLHNACIISHGNEQTLACQRNGWNRNDSVECQRECCARDLLIFTADQTRRCTERLEKENTEGWGISVCKWKGDPPRGSLNFKGPHQFANEEEARLQGETLSIASARRVIALQNCFRNFFID